MFRASGAGHRRKGLSTAQAGRQAVARVQAELLSCPRRGRWAPRLGSCQSLGGRCSSPAPVGVSRASGQHNHPSTGDTPQPGGHPWLEGLTGTRSSWAARGGGVKKRDADKQFHRERSPPLILSPQHSSKAAAGVHATLDALAACTHCTTEPGMPLVPHRGHRDRATRLLPTASTTVLPDKPTCLRAAGEVPATADLFLLRLNLLP